MPTASAQTLPVVVIGGGPAGLMAADVLSASGLPVELFDAMPSVGRKFLLAGKGGLNLTHGEASALFLQRYGAARRHMAPWLERFGPEHIRAWARDLGVSTFVGSSGRVFPTDLKAAPLLRAWMHRLRAQGVKFHTRHRWVGWSAAATSPAHAPTGMRTHTLQFEHRNGLDEADRMISVAARAVVLTLGGASWARLGSDGAWLPWLAACGVAVAPLRPSNCGFDVAHPAGGVWQPGWSDHLRERFAGQPLKTVALRCIDQAGGAWQQRGEFVVTATGIEGSLVYAASAMLRDSIEAKGHAEAFIDLLPDRSADFVRSEVMRPRGPRSLSTHLKSRLGIDGVKAALLYELLPRAVLADPVALASALKALPIRLVAPRPIDEAISTAGGVRFDAMDEGLLLKALPGVFCAGEMLDWEAPTGGYLLTASLASGSWAGQHVQEWLGREA